MLIETLSVFPEMFGPVMGSSILGRAQRNGIFEFHAHNLRDWTHDRHNTVDDYPFGGGQGMLMKPEPIFEAVEDIAYTGPKPHVVFFTPCGDTFTQRTAERLSHMERILMVCGRYEGIDERAYSLPDERLSIGDYVLTGGELAAMVVTDSIVRLLPGALGDEQSAVEESFSAGLLEFSQYTRPAVFRDMAVPDVLLSGNHAAIARWRREDALARTCRWRPDLLAGADLSDDERARAEGMLGSQAFGEDGEVG